MIDLKQAKQSEVGEDSPTNASKQAIDNIVDDVVSDVKPGDVPQEKNDTTPKNTEESTESPKEKTPEEKPETDEAAEEVTEETTEETTEDEDLVPRSKVQDRIDKLTMQVKKLEAENNKLTSKKPQSKEEKLERLSVEELKSLRRQTRLAQRTEQDQSRLEELMELEELVEDNIQKFPQRFQERQVKNLAAVLPDFAKIDPDVVQQKGDLWKIAGNIYSRSSALRSSEMGQVEAMLMAADHLNLIRSSNTSKEKGSTLQRQVTTLKKKTSLEGKTRVAQEKGVNLQKLREKAIGGDMVDKENFVREALVPDDFLQI